MKRVRRLMASDLAYGLALLAFVAAVVAWIYWPHGHARTVVRTTTTLVEVPGFPLTPLRDSGPKNNASKRGGQAQGATSGLPRLTRRPGPSSQNRSLPVKKRQGPKTTPIPRPSSQGSPQPSQPSNPPPSPPPPVVGVTAPAPVTVCAKPVATVNC